VFADVDPRTYNLDPVAARRAITPRTRAIMPVHQIGLPAEMDAFLAMGRERDVAIVEDAACAIGAEYKGRRIGSLGPLTCFSLHPRKVITTGEGGMITTNDAQLADRLRKLRQHAMDLSDLARHSATDIVFEAYPERGWNCRMTDLQAALGLCQIAALDEILSERRRQAERYTDALSSVGALELPYEPDDIVRTWQSYAVRVRPGGPLSRTELMRRLMHDGIATRRGVMAIHHEQAYGGSDVLLPHTEAAAREALMLPLFPGLEDAMQDRVIERLSAHLMRQAA
jgi:dTDP-4-amino-4,6-dideoxygalactose transaminase